MVGCGGTVAPPVQLEKSARTGKLDQSPRRLQQSRPESTVQAAVLPSHDNPLAWRQVVETHRKLHYAAIES